DVEDLTTDLHGHADHTAASMLAFAAINGEVTRCEDCDDLAPYALMVDDENGGSLCLWCATGAHGEKGGPVALEDIQEPALMVHRLRLVGRTTWGA
ncbi:MAG: hypothetical protein ACPGGE_06210, partial [Poseidonia sp.]